MFVCIVAQASIHTGKTRIVDLQLAVAKQSKHLLLDVTKSLKPGYPNYAKLTTEIEHAITLAELDTIEQELWEILAWEGCLKEDTR